MLSDRTAQVRRGLGTGLLATLVVGGGCALVGGLDGDFTLGQGAGGQGTGGQGTGGQGTGGQGASTGGSAGHCTDNEPNGDETDVDCGGSCSPCANGLLCGDHPDCLTGRCGDEDRCEMWSLHLSSTGTARLNDMAMLLDGGVVMVGSFSMSIELGTPHQAAGAEDMWVAKLSHTGQWDWAAHYGGDGEDRALTVSVAGTGDLVVAGTCSGADFGGAAGSHGDASNAAGCLLVLGGDGTPRWASSFSSSGDDSFESVAVDLQNGDIYAVGTFGDNNLTYDDCVVEGELTGQGDVIVAKYDENGNCAWARTTRSSSADHGRAIAVGSESIFIAGDFAAPMDGLITLDPPASGQDLFLAALSKAAVPTWAKAFGTTIDDTATDLAIGPNGGVLLAGHGGAEIDVGCGSSTTGSTSRAFVGRYAANGACAAELVLGGTAATTTTTAETIAAASDYAAVGGRFAGDSANLGGIGLPIANSSAGYVVRLQVTDTMTATGAMAFDYSGPASPSETDASVNALAVHPTWGKLVAGGWFTHAIELPGLDPVSADGIGNDAFFVSLGSGPAIER